MRRFKPDSRECKLGEHGTLTVIRRYTAAPYVARSTGRA